MTPNKSGSFAKAVPAIAVVCALLGGLYGGFFACGSHSGQPTVILGIVAVPSSIAVVWSLRASSLFKRAAFMFVIAATLWMSAHLGGAFYPGPPSGVRDFAERFLRGPC